MKKHDVSAFLGLMTSIAALYGQSLPEAVVEIYWNALQGFELSEVKAALQAHVKQPDTGQFMPKPADILRFLEGSGHTQALQAWSAVARAIREVGSYPSVVFDDPLIHAVIQDMGGWITLCQVLLKDLPFRERDFVARYLGYVLRPPPAYPRQLTGIVEHQNRLQNNESPPPLYLGDLEKALGVYHSGESLRYAITALPLSGIQEVLK